MNRAALWMLLVSFMVSFMVSGCVRTGQPDSGQSAPLMEPLALQQARAYRETVTGRFVPLIDFEDSGSNGRGFEQVSHFSLTPRTHTSGRRFVVNITRTGAGAMEVDLAPRSKLVFTIPGYRDFTGYTLISFALYSERLRDDLRVTLNTDTASWTSHRTLVVPGWNTVLIDIQRLQSFPNFDTTDVRQICFFFADAKEPIRFNIDDVMLIDNTRRITPVPKGITLRKSGLDYEITLPLRSDPITLSQGSDGLWRLGKGRAMVQMGSPGFQLPAGEERLGLMGSRKVGRVELLETNSNRLRLQNTWYFPTRPGEWVSLGIRQIRWEHTFYGDGRWVTHVELNNSGGEEIGGIRMWLDEEVGWSGGVISRDLLVREFVGPVGRWSFLAAPNSLQKKTLLLNYISSGAVVTTLGEREAFARGDSDKNGFDESRGCYYLRSVNGHCRFRIVPPPEGLLNPVFHVDGDWKGKVSVSGEGLAIRQVTHCPEGSVLFVVPGWIRHEMDVEVTGDQAPLSKPWEGSDSP